MSKVRRKKSIVHVVEWTIEDDYGSLALKKAFKCEDEAIAFAKKHRNESAQIHTLVIN